MFNRQRGVALVSVLLIVAILLAVVSRLMANHNLVINQHQNTFEQNQALHYALGAETLARQALYEDFSTSGKDVDHLGEIWAQSTMPFELDEGGYLEAQLSDMNGCFNLNALASASIRNGDDEPRNRGGGDSLTSFRRLLDTAGVNSDLAYAWKDWIDGDLEITRSGAEDSEYLVQQPPFRTPNQRVLHLSEIYLMPYVEREQLDPVVPFLCLLPEEDLQINVNTANAPTLAALHEEVTLAMAETIVATDRAFATVDEFVQQNEEFQPVQQQGGLLTVESQYFLLHAQAQVGSSSVTLQSLLYRDPSSGLVTVLQRDFGKLFRSQLTVDIEET